METAFKNKKSFRATHSFIFFTRQRIPALPHVCDQKAFTLIEVLIVVALIAILSVIAIPQINALVNNFQLKGATRLVWADLQNAKMTAIKTNQSVTVTFNTTTSYSFPRGDGTTFTRNLSSEYPSTSVSKTGGGTITFGSTGMTQNTTVTIQGSGGSKSISILWTGRVLIT